MSEEIELLIVEQESLPQAYNQLSSLTIDGHEPLEFFPHSEGVRILFKFNSEKQALKQQVVKITDKVLKAYLSQSESKLKNKLLIVETKTIKSLFELSNQLVSAGVDPIELRSIRSNINKNYGIFTTDSDTGIKQLLSGIDHVFIVASNPAIVEFLGFN